MKKKRVEKMTLEELDEAYKKEVVAHQIKKVREKEFKSKVSTILILIGVAIYILLELFG